MFVSPQCRPWMLNMPAQDVRRVYEFLAGNFQRAHRDLLPAKLTAKKSQLAEMQNLQRISASASGDDEHGQDVQRSDWSLSLEIAAIENEINDTKQLEEGPQVITIKDLDHALRTLGTSARTSAMSIRTSSRRACQAISVLADFSTSHASFKLSLIHI